MQSLPSGCLQSNVEIDMQTNLPYNTVKCFHGGIYKVQWELRKGKKKCIPGELRDSLPGEVATELRLD